VYIVVEVNKYSVYVINAIDSTYASSLLQVGRATLELNIPIDTCSRL